MATLSIEAAADDEANKRRKVLQEALDLDKDDEDDEDDKDKQEKEDEEEEYASIFALSFTQTVAATQGRR